MNNIFLHCLSSSSIHTTLKHRPPPALKRKEKGSSILFPKFSNGLATAIISHISLDTCHLSICHLLFFLIDNGSNRPRHGREGHVSRTMGQSLLSADFLYSELLGFKCGPAVTGHLINRIRRHISCCQLAMRIHVSIIQSYSWGMWQWCGSAESTDHFGCWIVLELSYSVIKCPKYGPSLVSNMSPTWQGKFISFQNLLVSMRISCSTHSNLVGCNDLQFFLFVSLDTRYKTLINMKTPSLLWANHWS